MINQPKKQAKIETKAEMVITVVWPDGYKSDVDTWLEDPHGGIVWYKNKNVWFSHLDRDDLGNVKDMITLPDGSEVFYPHNQELTTIRGILSGEWTLNIHLYKKRDVGDIPVEIAIDKLNPSVKRVFYATVILTMEFEEKTITRFTMTKEGHLLDWNKIPKELVKKQIISNFGTFDEGH